MHKLACSIDGSLNPGYLPHGINSRIRSIEDSQNQHRKHRPDTTQCHKAKAVFLRAFITSKRSQTNTHRHNKRNGYRPGGNTARVKRHRNKGIRCKTSHKKDKRIKAQKQDIERNLKKDTRNGKHHKSANTSCYCKHNHKIGNCRDLLCKYLQVWLCHCDNNTKNKT